MQKELKYLAFYLPQFHEFKENNEWWGKGFTEWTNVKKAKPLYSGHYQPQIPLDENYYDLSKTETLSNQAKVAKKYGIYGFCFYHYWFNGKVIMDMPLNLLLDNSDIDINYCFSWANETWSRRWDGHDSEILIKQEYGDEKEWEMHFNYLLPFFKDERYIKIDNCPMLLIYRAFEIYRFDDMIEYFNARAKKEGFDGIYFLETITSVQKEVISSKTKGSVIFEPMYTVYNNLTIPERIKRYAINHLHLYNLGILDFIDYERLSKEIKKRDNKESFLGCFPKWDNTPRRGKKGLMIRNTSPDKFEDQLFCISKKSVASGRDFVFINAWNEWAEGAYLEADEKNKYGYLKAIQNVRIKLGLN